MAREFLSTTQALVDQWCGEASGGLFADVGWQGDTCGLEHRSDHAGSRCANGNNLAVFLDGGLLEAVEIVEERLPFGCQPFDLAQTG